MNSALRMITSSNIMDTAERAVIIENIRLNSDERKRRLLSFGPIGQGIIVGVGSGGIDISQNNGTNSQLSTSGFRIGTTTLSGLECLNQTGHLFIRHAGQSFVEKFFDLANKYEILNSEGSGVLYAGETLERFGVGKGGIPVFDVSILGLDGSGLLNISSQKGVTTVSDFHKVIGTFIDVSSPFAPYERYSIRDWNMCEIFRVRKSTNIPVGEFDILTKEMSKIGQFTTNWSPTFPNYAGIDKLYGISFPVDMATEEKVILFGALFTLYFQQLHQDGFGNKKGKFWRFCLCVFILFLFIIGILILILWAVLRD